MAAPTTTHENEMDAFYQMLESKHMNALWRRRPDTSGRSSAAPYAPARLRWHGHISKGSEPMMWMDSLDAPLVGLLRVGMSQEPYPDEIEPATKPVGDSHSRFGIGHLKPVWHKEISPVSPLAYFPWEQSE